MASLNDLKQWHTKSQRIAALVSSPRLLSNNSYGLKLWQLLRRCIGAVQSQPYSKTFWTRPGSEMTMILSNRSRARKSHRDGPTTK